jgi:hypothetical protein
MNLIHGARGSDRHSNQAPPEYNSEALNKSPCLLKAKILEYIKSYVSDVTLN